jgi:haloalkane dehalogenase
VSKTAISRRGYVDVAGRQCHFRSAGDPSLPILLLLHQSPSSSAMYEPLMQHLQERYHLLAPDTPGFGNSDPLEVSPGALTIADYASAIRGFCRELDVEHCHIFGHHTGAAIAVQLEHDFPGLAVSMALSGPTLLSDEQKRGLPGLAGSFPLERDGKHLQAMWQRLRDKDREASLALSQRELISAFTCGDSYQASYVAVTRQDFGKQLESLACPVLVFAGGEDPLHAAVEPTLARLADGHHVVAPERQGTYICEREAQWLAQALHEFYSGKGR